MARPKRSAVAPGLCVTITALGTQGDGVAEHEGDRIFVPYTVPGDRVRLTAPVKAPDGWRAQAAAWLETGPDRQDAACPHFGTCGGCSLQHLRSEAYGLHKHARVRTAIAQAGADPAVLAEPLITLPPGSRRRARFVAQRARRAETVRVGFQQARSHTSVDVTACPILEPALVGLLPRLRQSLPSVLPPGARCDIQATRLDEGAFDILLIGPDSLSGPARETLGDLAQTAGIARLSWKRNDQDVHEPVAHREPVSLTFGKHRVTPPPGGFLQPTADGERHLAAFVVAACGQAERIADLFAGCGSFALRLIDSGPAGRRVLAAEGDAAAVDALQAAGSRVTTLHRDLARQPLAGAELHGLDAVVLDPPRAGARAQTAAIAAAAVPLVLMVSCNPSTWTRDARLLMTEGYRLEQVIALDQFLWSAHVELAGVFRTGQCPPTTVHG